MSRTSTSSWWSMSNVVDSGALASWASAWNTSAYMRASRAGVSTTPSRSEASPIAERISLSDATRRAWSTAISAILPLGGVVAGAGAGLAALRGTGDLRSAAARMGQLGRVRLQRLAGVVLLRAGRSGGAADRRRGQGGALCAGDPDLAR